MDAVFDAVNQDYLMAAKNANQPDHLNPYSTVRDGVLIPFESKVSLRVRVMDWPPETHRSMARRSGAVESLIALVVVEKQHIPWGNRNLPKKKVERVFHKYVHNVLQRKAQGGHLYKDIDPSFYPLSFDYSYLTSGGDKPDSMEHALQSTMVKDVVPLLIKCSTSPRVVTRSRICIKISARTPLPCQASRYWPPISVSMPSQRVREFYTVTSSDEGGTASRWWRS